MVDVSPGFPGTNMESLKRQNTAWRFLKVVVRRIPLERRDVPIGFYSMIDGVTKSLARTR